jgi:hypothetical protein
MKAKRNIGEKAKEKQQKSKKGEKCFFLFCVLWVSVIRFGELLVSGEFSFEQKGRKRFIKVELHADGATRRSLV